MPRELTLPTLLSQPVVAFTIEVDNDFEHEMALAGHPGKRLSFTMWWRRLRHLPDDGLSVAELDKLAFPVGKHPGTGKSGLERHGYVVFEPPKNDALRAPREGFVLKPTDAGRQANRLWEQLPSEAEERWQERHNGGVDELLVHLRELASKLDPDLPPYLPRFGRLPGGDPVRTADSSPRSSELYSLLARRVTAFGMEFDAEADAVVPLALAANFLRVLDEDQSVALSQLPVRTGVARRAVDRLLGYLERSGYVVVAVETRRKHARLTPRGAAAKQATRELVRDVESRWHQRYGDGLIASLRATLEQLQPRLGNGLMPPSDGWRASRPYLAQTKAMIEDGALRTTRCCQARVTGPMEHEALVDRFPLSSGLGYENVPLLTRDLIGSRERAESP